MIDQGLLLSAAAVVAVVWVLARLAPPRTLAAGDVLDASVWAVFAGLMAGRVTAMILDDPSGLRRLGDILILRGGVEFWPGLAVGSGVLALSARRQGVAPGARLADVAPYGLAAYAVYEAACVVRDGCFGPVSSLGLAPAGVGEPQFPVGVALALGVAGLAVGVYRTRAWTPGWSLLLALASLAAARYLAAFWLPRIGSGPTRPQVESLAVLLGAVAIALGSLVAGRTRTRKTASSSSPGPTRR